MGVLPNCQVDWPELPDDFRLEEGSLDNINKPLLAAALTDSLETAGYLTPNSLIISNYGICAKINGNILVKAPDWCYIPNIKVPREELKRCYTPKLQGDIPTIVMEFVSGSDEDEYSIKPSYPQGKYFLYQEIMRVQHYLIYYMNEGIMELLWYNADPSVERYRRRIPDEKGLYWIEEMNLYLGVWEGTREQRKGTWLRWWDAEGNLLLWASEKANLEKQRADQLAAQLKSLGVEPDN